MQLADVLLAAPPSIQTDAKFCVIFAVSDEEGDAGKEDLQKTCVLQMRGLSCYFPGCVVPDGSVQPPATEERPEGVVYWSDLATWGLSAYWYMESGATGTGLPTGNISQITVPEGELIITLYN